MKRSRPLLALTAIAWVVTGASPAMAHTTSDTVAVPAGSEATVTLKPTHGCGGSPTVEVRIRAPLEDAEAVPVDGWTETAEADDDGNTILTWTDGSLPADETGKFPITFTAPDTVGEVLTFPSIQDCENGEELAWIDGDPEAEFPAPRLLILDADAEPAETIDDVPLDAPGRDQLVEVIDIDNPVASSVPQSTGVPTTDGTDGTDVTTTDGTDVTTTDA